MDRVSSCNIYVNQPDTQRFMIEFIHNTWRLDVFRTLMVHPQERLKAVCCRFWYVVIHSFQTLLRMDH